MPKRFTDTEKWKKKFFRALQAPYKLVWLYLLDECDHAGVWEVEFDVLKLRTGISCSEQELLKIFSGKIFPFDNGEKWFIEEFIYFQYGELNPSNRVHKSILSLLAKYENKGLVSPLQGAKDKDKDKEMDKNMEKEKEITKEKEKYTGLARELAAHFPEKLIPKTPQEGDKWLDTIRLLIEKDGYSQDDIRQAVIWARSDSFWSTNFLSLSKLRRKDKDNIQYIQRFIIEMNKNGTGQTETYSDLINEIAQRHSSPECEQ